MVAYFVIIQYTVSTVSNILPAKLHLDESIYRKFLNTDTDRSEQTVQTQLFLNKTCLSFQEVENSSMYILRFAE